MALMMRRQPPRRICSLELDGCSSPAPSPPRRHSGGVLGASALQGFEQIGGRRCRLSKAKTCGLFELAEEEEPMTELGLPDACTGFKELRKQLPAPPNTAPPLQRQRRHHHHRRHSVHGEGDVTASSSRPFRLPPVADALPALALEEDASGRDSEAPGMCHRRERSKPPTASITPMSQMTTPSKASSSSAPRSEQSTSCCTTPMSVDSSSVAARAQASAPLPRIQNMSWRRGEKIGSGSYGAVYKALSVDFGLIFAVKQAIIDNESEEDRRFREQLAKEIDICKDLRHPNIVSYLGHAYHDSKLYIYLEYAAGGSLASVYREFGPVEGALLVSTSSGLLQGLNYLHTRATPIVHRDIKCANVLVDLNFCVKLADFGCSKRNLLTTSFTTMGSVPWMAPEVILQENGYGRKADVWSLGCTIIEMATAEKPWGSSCFDNVMYAMRHISMSNETPPVHKDLGPQALSFIAACVRRSPSDRPWTEELLKHEYVRAAALGAGGAD